LFLIQVKITTQFDAIEFSIGAPQRPGDRACNAGRSGSAGAEPKFGVRRFLDEANEEADMGKFLILCAAAAALILVSASAPADAASRKAQSVIAGQAVQIDLSARRYYRRHVYRYYRPRYRYYYPGPYYYAYPYYLGPRYYRYHYPYGRYYYYRRPGFYFGFGF
jgi:hypothetical protein